VVFGLVPIGLGIFGAATHANGLVRGVWLGLVLAGVATTTCWVWSLAFETAHPHESAEFWLRHEAKIRPRFFRGSAMTVVVGVVVLTLAAAAHWPMLAGLAVAPTVTAACVVVLMWGKVP
jgi:4-hydroxybenzoate polyprenyltransferase